MFFCKNKNCSGTVSIQIVEKINRTNRIVKTVGIASIPREEEILILLAKKQLEQIQDMQSLFVGHDDLVVENFVYTLSSGDLQIVGPELILAPIYQKIGYSSDGLCTYFKGLIFSRSIYPESKLKEVEYFKKNHLNLKVSVYTIYHFPDELVSTLKSQIEELTFAHTTSIMGGSISVIFYNMTSLYFEAFEPDDFRVSGFSKDRKYQHSQILIGLLVSGRGYPICYQLFEDNPYEANTLIPVLETCRDRFGVEKRVKRGILSKQRINNRGYNK